MDWNDIIKTVTTNAIFMAVLGFVAKSVFDQFLSRDIENYKTKLQATQDIKLEELKSELSKSAHEHQIVFSRLHEIRADVIARLYELLVNTEDAYQNVALGLYTNIPLNEQKMQDAVNKWRELKSYFSRNRIYFNSFVCAKMEELINVFGESAVQYIFLEDDGSVDINAIKTFSDLISNAIPEIKSLIEDEFREMLGINSVMDDSQESDIPF